MEKLIAAFLSLFLMISTATARTRPQEELDRYLEAAVEAWNFRGAALVACGGDVIISHAYGPANEQFNLPNDTATKFIIGSITKQFTAAAILKLHDMGKLDLNRTIDDFIPDYPQPAGSTVTVSQLLTHTSGIPNYTALPQLQFGRTHELSPPEIMNLFKSLPLEFEPGSRFAYSNSGYIVLGEIIERVSGQSYEAFLHHELFKPCGMNSSGYGRREAGLPQRADGYTVDENNQPIAAVPISYSVLHTAGALYSTVGDMFRWNRCLDEGCVLSRSSMRMMFTDHGFGYGYGWYIDSVYGRPHYFHGGFLDGFNTTVERWPEDKLLVIIFSNEDEAPVKKMARGLASICLFDRPYVWPEKHQPINLDNLDFSQYDGVYQPNNGPEHVIAADGDSLFIQLPEHERDRLLPVATDSFFLLTDNTVSLTFFRDAFNEPVGYHLWDEGITIKAFKIETEEAFRLLEMFRAQPVDPAVHGAVVGTYRIRSEMVPADSSLYITITLEDCHLFASVGNFERIELVPRSDLEFFHRTGGFSIVFNRNESGNIDTCLIHMGNQTVVGRRVP
ncbi:MAG TPA: serine hydrolase domain-containing protein [candidate division Zixibacteria bacterium]|nr:serine hydrolase domain-containing protein [candidate division Zixibacteria bacterium]